MKELKEISFSHNTVQLKDNLVRGAILPKVAAELDRDIVIDSDTIIEGAVYSHKLEIKNGDTEIKGAVFAQLEVHVNSDATGNILFRKSVGSANSVVSHAQNCRTLFLADINAKQVKLTNAFVAGSIFADEVTLTNSIVLGGVFATQKIAATNSIMGTFNSQFVVLEKENGLLLPSAFSVMRISAPQDAVLYNLCLADLGALYQKEPEDPNSGKVLMDLNADELETVLTSEDSQQTLHSYTIVGKVLAADLVDMDKLQNHFLITAASLGSQLLQSYNFGKDEEGKPKALTPERIADFFFDLLQGRIVPQLMKGNFSIKEVMEKFS